jgi:hypothetical protein
MKTKYSNILIASLLFSVSCGINLAHAGLISITGAELEANHTQLNFSSATVGNISSSNSYFQNFGLSGVEVLGVTSHTGDTLSAGTDGKALGSFQGQLSIVDVGDGIDNFDMGMGLSFSFIDGITQFGFQLIDQRNLDLTIDTFLNGVLIDSLIYSSGSSSPVPIALFQSDTLINQFKVTQTEGLSGWALDNIVKAGVEVPEPSTLAIFVLGMIGLASRRFKKQS